MNHNYYAETFAPEEEKVMPMIFVVNDALLDSEAMYLEINPTGAVIDMNCSPSSRQLKKYKFFLPVEIICWQFYAACK